MAYQIGVLTCFMIYLSYFCERKFKEEFIQKSYNEKMHNSLRLILESLPEGVMVLDQSSHEVLFSNKSMKRFLSQAKSPDCSRVESPNI